MQKIILTIYILLSFGNLQAQAPSNFVIMNNSGSTALTCSTHSLYFSAFSSAPAPNYFTWTNGTSTLTGVNVVITSPGNYTVTISDSSQTIFGTQYLAISNNTMAPNSSVSPSLQNITCNPASVTGVTANLSGSATHTFISPYGLHAIYTGTSAAYTPMGIGTYTHILLDHSTGCQGAATFSVFSNQNFPTFDVAGTQDYTLGCGTKTAVAITILNSSTNPPGGPVSYSLISPGQSTILPAGSLSNVNNYTITNAGVYTLMVRDNVSFCTVQIPFTILDNAVVPNVSITNTLQILTCAVPQITLQGISSNANVSLNWNTLNGSVTGSTITANANANVTQTIANTYTFIVVDNNNSCKSNSVITIYQNLFPPIASITTANNYTITCATPTIVLTNTSHSGIPTMVGFPFNMPVVALSWFAPNQSSLGLSTTFTANTSGTYTMIAKDLNNDCISQTTAVIFGDCNLVGLAKNNLLKSSIALFPNPAHDFITLVTEENEFIGSLEIYNALGQIVLTQKLSVAKTQVDLSSLSNGMYVINILQNNHAIQTSKFVKY